MRSMLSLFLWIAIAANVIAFLMNVRLRAKMRAAMREGDLARAALERAHAACLRAMPPSTRAVYEAQEARERAEREAARKPRPGGRVPWA